MSHCNVSWNLRFSYLEMYNFSGSRVVKLISDKDMEIYQIVDFVIITGIISLFGVAANVINILVFYKQGFNNTMNISFFGIAISDLCGLITLLWVGVCENPLFVQSDVVIVPREVEYLTGDGPHACFARITGWITVFITAERCLCVTLPLKIKQIITPKRTTMTVVIIYIAMVASFLPEYATSYFDWKFYPEKNRTLLGLVFTKNRKNMEGVMFITYSFLGTASFILVIVFTIILTVQLKQKSKWRKSATVDKTKSDAMSTRERKTLNMVVMIATVLIVCYTPGVAVSMVTFLEPEITIAGVNVNVFFALWSIAFIFDAINSSVNIFLYYNMSTKYRETFYHVLGMERNNHNDQHRSTNVV